MNNNSTNPIMNQQVDVTVKISLTVDAEYNAQVISGNVECIIEKAFNESKMFDFESQEIKTVEEEHEIYMNEGGLYLATFEVRHGETSDTTVKVLFEEAPSLDPMKDFAHTALLDHFGGVYGEMETADSSGYYYNDGGTVVYTLSIVALDKDEYEVLKKYL